MRSVPLESLGMPFTPEELRQAEEALARAPKVREQLLKARGGKLFPPAEDDLRELRGEGDGQHR